MSPYRRCSALPLNMINLLQGEVPNYQLHLIGFCEAHSGTQGLVVKTLVTEVSQAGNIKGTQRCGQGWECRTVCI